MKNMRKLFAILLTLALLVPCLTACGASKLIGKYKAPDDDDFRLTISKEHFEVKNGQRIIYGGPYTVKGKTITVDSEEGSNDNVRIVFDYKFEKNFLFLTFKQPNGGLYTFVRIDSGSGGSVWKTIGIIVLILAALAVIYTLLKKRGRGGRTTNAQVQDKLYRATRTVAASAANVGGRAAATARELSSAVASGMSAGVAAGKAAQRERRRVELTPYTCCICGASLENEGTPLAGLPSGQEAWICQSCLGRLQTLAQSEDPGAFEAAVRYVRTQAQYTDPEVSESLLRFVEKSEARFRPNTDADPFTL